MGKPHVVIVGGGFGGLAAAKALARAPVRVTVLDRHNHHLFQPLLYQVATAGLSPAEIASPIRRILGAQRNTTVFLAEAVAVEPEARRVRLADGAIDYDHLIVATGATHSYFGHPDWASHAPGLKSLADALEIRRRVLLAFENAERETEAGARRRWLTFVVVGGGPTGVEMAGAFAEIARHTLPGEFRHIDPRTARVVLVEAGSRVLPAYPADLSARAARQLEALGVHVWTGVAVTDVNAEGVALGVDRLAAGTVVWAAGVEGSSLARSLGVPLDRAGRVEVAPDLTVPGRPEIAVIGDLAAIESSGRLVPGVAPAAIQMGRHAAANVIRALGGEPRLPFCYRDKGSLATIGRSRAVAVIGRLKLSGFLAWAAWLVVHVFFLIGFRNRFVVMFTWIWAYLTYERSARLIVPRAPPTPAPADSPRPP
jgi:NADH dehydrogenase